MKLCGGDYSPRRSYTRIELAVEPTALVHIPNPRLIGTRVVQDVLHVAGITWARRRHRTRRGRWGWREVGLGETVGLRDAVALGDAVGLGDAMGVAVGVGVGEVVVV